MNTLMPIISTTAQASPFNSNYNAAKALFQSNGHFRQLSATTCKGLAWPSENGVYIVWQISPVDEVLYIGMTGKFSQKGKMSGPGLKGRKNRWTPYLFDETADVFSFGPRYAKGEKRDKAPKKGYSHSIVIANIRIDCFEYSTTHKMAPAFLEALLLQGFLMQHGCLPRANQKL